MVKNIAIIPARGGSKRIPKKNIIDFNGKPMIAWTINAALESKQFARVIVSTDSNEIAAVSQEYGAEVPFLREKYADDFSPVSLATAACLENVSEYYGEEYTRIVQLMPNCPIRDSADIVKALNNLEKEQADFQISVFRYGWMNPWWAISLEKDNTFQFKFPESKVKRSQDLAELMCPTGAIWAASASKLLDTKNFYTENTIGWEIDWKSAVDIDDYNDLEMANALYLMKNK